jgi:hypothetical protein
VTAVSLYIGQQEYGDYDEHWLINLVETTDEAEAVREVHADLVVCGPDYRFEHRIIRYDIEGTNLAKWVLPFGWRNRVPTDRRTKEIPWMGEWKEYADG